MPPNSFSSAMQAKSGHSSNCSPVKEVPATISTILKQQLASDMEVFTASTMGSYLSRSTINFPITMSLTNSISRILLLLSIYFAMIMCLHWSCNSSCWLELQFWKCVRSQWFYCHLQLWSCVLISHCFLWHWFSLMPQKKALPTGQARVSHSRKFSRA